MFCAVEDCANPKSRSRYFSFPKDPYLCRKWMRFCRRSNSINPKVEKICMEHFQKDDFERDLPYELGVYLKPRPLKLKPDAVPSINNNFCEDFELQFAGYQPVDYYEMEDQEVEEKGSSKAKLVAQREQIVDDLIAEYEKQQAQQRDEEELGESEGTEEQLEYEPDEEEDDEEEIVQVVVDADEYLKELERENTELRREHFKMKLAAQKEFTEKEKLRRELEISNSRYNKLYSNLEETFSKAQILKLQNGKRIVWPENDIREASALYAISPSAYLRLLQKNYPLPSRRTLQKWEREMHQRESASEVASNQESCELIEIEVIDMQHIDHNYVN